MCLRTLLIDAFLGVICLSCAVVLLEESCTCYKGVNATLVLDYRTCVLSNKIDAALCFSDAFQKGALLCGA